MHESDGVQACEAVLHLDAAADLQLKLSHRPRALLLPVEEERQERAFAGLSPCLVSRVLLHGKEHPFPAAAPGSWRCAGANISVEADAASTRPRAARRPRADQSTPSP